MERSHLSGPFRPPKTETRSAPPHIAAKTAVMDYFKKKYPGDKNETRRKQLCSEALTCEPWSVEPELMQDLIEARLTDDQTKLEMIRKCLRAVSWQEHTQKTLEEQVRVIHHIKADLEHEMHMFERINDDSSQGLHEQLKELDVILQALKQGKRGSDAEPAAKATEDLLWNDYQTFNHVKEELQTALDTGWEPETARVQKLKAMRQRLNQRIHSLRALRDQIYFQALYDGWYISDAIKQAV